MTGYPPSPTQKIWNLLREKADESTGDRRAAFEEALAIVVKVDPDADYELPPWEPGRAD
jgi:hypothetical protein